MSTVVQSAPAFRNAVRAHTSLLAGAEKGFLVRTASRLPAWVTSDQLTALGAAGMFLFGASYAAARWNHTMLLAAILFLGINWFGDSLDGTLARVRNRQRPRYGFYLDHVVDSFGALFVLCGMALSGCMSPAIAAGLLTAYLLLSIEIYLAAYTLGTFHLSFWKLGPTELRVLMAIGTLRVYFNPTAKLFGSNYFLLDLAGAISIAVLMGIALASVIRHPRALYRLEPPL